MHSVFMIFKGEKRKKRFEYFEKSLNSAKDFYYTTIIIVVNILWTKTKTVGFQGRFFIG